MEIGHEQRTMPTLVDTADGPFMGFSLAASRRRVRNRGNRGIDATGTAGDDLRVVNHSIVLLAYDGVQPLDVVGPHEVFAGANAFLDEHRSTAPRYEIRIVSPESPVTGESGLQLVTQTLGSHPRNDAPIGTLVLPGGNGVHAAVGDDALVSWVQYAGSRAERLATVCSGAFLAAAAGLLDERTVTTHWARADQLAQQYPTVTVTADSIYVRDGDVWSSAGVTAGIDLALALVDHDHGAAVAHTVARWMVMFRHRPGGQAQFAAPMLRRRADTAAVVDAQAFIDSNPNADLRVERLAARASLSERHFARLFTAEVGEPPARYVERVRIDAARQLLETTTDTLDVVAQCTGIGSAETLRRAFHRSVGVTPDAYRQRFRRPPSTITQPRPTTPARTKS